MEQKIEMEVRPCVGCSNDFKVFVKSKQKYCSRSCEMLNSGGKKEHSWDARKSQLKNGKPGRESITVNVGPKILSGVSGNEQNKKPDGTKIMNATSREVVNTMKIIKSENSHNEKNGLARIRNDNSPHRESTTMKTKKDSEISSMQPEEEETPVAVSTEPSTNVSLVTSPSMSLLDDTAKHLHDLMKGLHKDQPDPTIKLYDPDRVNSACNCAKQIYSIMRLKLDAIKIQQEMK